MRKPKTYYTLLSLQPYGWCREFGDYDRECVEFELQDWRDHGLKKSSLKIIKSGSSEAEVQAAISSFIGGQS